MRHSDWNRRVGVFVVILSSPFSRSATQEDHEILSLEGAYWVGGSSTTGELESAMLGGANVLIVSANGVDGYPSSTFMWIDLENNYSTNAFVEITVRYCVNPGQTTFGTVYWNDTKVLATGTGKAASEEDLYLIQSNSQGGTRNVPVGFFSGNGDWSGLFSLAMNATHCCVVSWHGYSNPASILLSQKPASCRAESGLLAIIFDQCARPR